MGELAQVDSGGNSDGGGLCLAHSGLVQAVTDVKSQSEKTAGSLEKLATKVGDLQVEVKGAITKIGVIMLLATPIWMAIVAGITAFIVGRS